MKTWFRSLLSQIHLYRYTLVDLEDYVSRPDKISAADIRSICQVGLCTS